MMTKETPLGTARQLPIQKNSRFEQVFHKDHRDCDCEIPMVTKKWNDALGRMVNIRLCCMAKLVDEIAERLGIDTRRVYEVFDFDPKWVWDCDELHESIDLDGTVTKRPRGNPPKWLAKRLRDKGLEIRGMDEPA